LRLRKHSCPIRTGDILFDVAVNRGDGTLYAVVQDARFSGFPVRHDRPDAVDRRRPKLVAARAYQPRL
jgi:hypothetical protein